MSQKVAKDVILGTMGVGALVTAGWVWFAGPIYYCYSCSPLAEDLVTNIRTHPEDWKENPHYFYNQKLNVNFWIANGPGYFAPRPLTGEYQVVPDEWDTGPGPATWEQRYVWTAYREWSATMNRVHPVRLEDFTAPPNNDK